jgi:hypothetical protein
MYVDFLCGKYSQSEINAMSDREIFSLQSGGEVSSEEILNRQKYLTQKARDAYAVSEKAATQRTLLTLASNMTEASVLAKNARNAVASMPASTTPAEKAALIKVAEEATAKETETALLYKDFVAKYKSDIYKKAAAEGEPVIDNSMVIAVPSITADEVIDDSTDALSTQLSPLNKKLVIGALALLGISAVYLVVRK